MRLPFVVVLLAACTGCGEPTTSAPDASPVDASAPDTGAGLSPIAPPALPAFECADGWAAISLGEEAPTVCDPFPAGLAPCADDAMWIPGGSACAPIGEACPADGGFPSDLPPTGIVYVRAGSAGDGSAAAPFGTVAEGIAAAADGETVLVAAGRYAEGATLDRPVVVRGTCLDAVIVRAIYVHADARLENLRLEGNVDVRSPLVLRDVALRDLTDTAISVSSTTLSLENVSVRGGSGEGLAASNGAIVVGRRVELSGIHGATLDLLGSSVTLEDVSIVRDEASVGELAVATGGSTLDLSRFAVDSSSSTAMIALESSIRLASGRVRGADVASGVEGPGLLALQDSTLELSQVWLSGMRGFGASAGTPRARIIARDVVIDDTRASGGSENGQGIVVGPGGHAELDRVWIERSRSVALLVSDADADAVVRDLTILDTAAAPDGFLGRGIQVQSGAHLAAERVRIDGSHEASIIAASSDVELSDLRVTRTLRRACAPCEPAGIGVASYLGATVRITRFSISRSELSAVQIAREGGVDLVDGEIFDNPIGVNLQVPGYDLTRLQEGVVYRDNGVNLDSTSLEVPDPTAPTT